VSPEFFANHQGRFGLEHFHVQGSFEMSEIDFSGIPSPTVEPNGTEIRW
jgi:hypothetical protein